MVPARNSGESIIPCVQSILRQDYERFHVTLIDDRSEDDTAAHLEQLARSDSRIQVMRMTTLPAGWLGKSHALWKAAIAAQEDWLCFLDDDCLLDPKALSTALHHAEAEGADLLTLWPRHLAGSFWEHALVPLCGAVIALWFGTPEVNGSDGRAAFGNSQFLLVRRDAYLRMGGHAGVRDAIIEDVPLAEHARQAGLKCRVACGADLFGAHMYRSFTAIIHGWSRIYVGALRSGRRLLVSMLWLLFGNLWPFLATPVFLSLGWTAAAGSPAASIGMTAAAVGLLHLGLISVVSYRFWGYGRCNRKYLLIYPLSVFLVTGILARAWWQLTVTRHVSWRDTTYPIDRHARIISHRPPATSR